MRDARAGDADARAAILDAAGRDLAATLGLLTRTDAPDSARLLVIEALVPGLAPSELLSLGRFAGGQRQPVAERLGELLAARAEPEAALLLRAVVAPRAPSSADQIEAAASRILSASAGGRALHAGLVAGLDGLRPGELGAAIVASSPGALAEARSHVSEDPGLRLAVEEELALLDDAFRAGGTSEGERRLRTALYRAVNVLGLPGEGELASRAEEWLFRQDDLGAVRELAPYLPDSALERYAERALTAKNRNGDRADRAVAALELLRDEASPEVQAATRKLVVECLAENSPVLRSGALHALAAQANELDDAIREQVAAAYAALEPAEQAAIASDMRVLRGEAARLDDEALLRWAMSAPDDEAESRLETLLRRWRSGAPSNKRVEEFIQTSGALATRLEGSAEAAALDEVVRTAAHWLRQQGARLAGPFEALRSWDGFTTAAAARTPILVELLLAEQTRRALLDIGRAGPAEIAQIASAPVDDDATERVLMPPLAGLAGSEHAPHVLKAWADPACTRAGQRRLAAGALLAIGTLKRDIADLAASASSRELAALDARLQHVLDALAEAETDAAGNSVLLEHFASLRRSISGMLSDETVREPSERVQAWRRVAAGRFAEFVKADDGGRQVLQLAADPREHAADLNSILLELDQRAHNPRVLNETERADTAEDLDALARAVANAGMLAMTGPLAPSLARPALGQVLLAHWAEAETDDADELLADELALLVDPTTAKAALPRVDALAGRQPSTARVLSATGTVSDDDLDAVWRGVSAALRERLKQRADLKRRALGRDAEAMERVAERMDPPMRAIESLLFSYFRFRSLLGAAGWLPLQDQLGAMIKRDRVDPEVHEVQGDSTAETFVVRSLGLKAKGQVVARAVLEPQAAEADGGTA